MSLWSNPEVSAWKAALRRCVQRMEVREVNRLPELDAWYREELPVTLAARTPLQLSRDELVDITRWKMKRGAYRAQNLVRVKANPERQVEARSREAFAAIPDPRRPVALLCELGGVGPATASAVLAAVRPELYPFFDEDVAKQVPGLGKVAFTLPFYLRYAEALKEKARALGGRLTPQDVAQALWATRE